MVAHRDQGGRGEAATELENFVSEIHSGQVQTENRVRTLCEVLTACVDHCRRIGRRQSTVESYEMVAKRITTEMNAKPIDTLTGHDFDEFYGDLGKTLGANTIRQTHAVLHAAFDQAVKWESIRLPSSWPAVWTWTRQLVDLATPPKSWCRAMFSDRTIERLQPPTRWKPDWPHGDSLLPNCCQCRSTSRNRRHPTNQRVHLERVAGYVQRMPYRRLCSQIIPSTQRDLTARSKSVPLGNDIWPRH